MDQNQQNLILKKRAQKLAVIEKKDSSKELQGFQVVKFTLSNNLFGLEAECIHEVYPLKEVTFLPMVPSFIYGIINVRRRIISVVDLHVLFGLKKNKENFSSKVIILKKADKEFAILADEVIGIDLVNPTDVQMSLPTLTGFQLEFLKGITSNGLTILDGYRLLTDPRLQVEETVDL